VRSNVEERDDDASGEQFPDTGSNGDRSEPDINESERMEGRRSEGRQSDNEYNADDNGDADGEGYRSEPSDPEEED